MRTFANNFSSVSVNSSKLSQMERKAHSFASSILAQTGSKYFGQLLRIKKP